MHVMHVQCMCLYEYLKRALQAARTSDEVCNAAYPQAQLEAPTRQPDCALAGALRAPMQRPHPE